MRDASEGIRREMIAQQIESRGVHDPRVLAAIESIPRERFVPASAHSLAYEDRALAIDQDQTISQPYIVAYMTEALRVGPRDKVLEIGTGSGYQTAILCKLVERLYTVERLSSLSETAGARLGALGISNFARRVGDGSLGWPEEAPFDRIIVTAAAPSIPAPLVEQLTVGGLLVIPVGGADQQTLVSVSKLADRTVERSLLPCRFVKFIGRWAWS